MAVAAIDSETAYVMFMAERDRLFARHILHGFVRRSHDQVGKSADDHQSTDKTKNAEPGKGIGASGEVLRHQRRFRTDCELLHFALPLAQRVVGNYRGQGFFRAGGSPFGRSCLHVFDSRSCFILTCQCNTRQCVLSRNYKSGSFDRRARFWQSDVFCPDLFRQLSLRISSRM